MSNEIFARFWAPMAGRLISVCNAVLDKVFVRYLLVHTPKCGGTYLLHQYDIAKNRSIKSVGHAHFRSLNIPRNVKIVGLIREPMDWYASYYYFCKKNLSQSAQSIVNFPVNHPISMFSQNAETDLETMIYNMSDCTFLERIVTQDISANVYAREINDLYTFMERTGSGFWSWTMMYHFSKKDTKEMRTRADVISEAREISRYVDFIHQKSIDEDVERVFGMAQRSGALMNDSPRPSQPIFNHRIRAMVQELDGEVADALFDFES